MKYLLSILSASCLFIACDSQMQSHQGDSDTTRYEVVFRESNAGIFKKWNTGSNSFGFYYTYTDRGRGPMLFEEISTNDQNFITSHTISGVNYLKDSVNEYFEGSTSTAKWDNPGGKSEGSFSGQELYFRYDGSPASYEILARLLLASDNQKISLYPQGEVELINDYSLNLEDEFGANLLMIKGLGMNPSFLWMKDNQMIARISGNLHVVRDDLSSLRPKMKVLQDSIEDNYLIEVAKNLTHKVNKTVIQNVNVFTADGSLLSNQDVLVNETKIEAISPTGGSVPDGVVIIDGTGKTLMPGMFDMHTHNSKFRGSLHIAGGVTSTRDLANNKQVMSLSEQFSSNEIIGPNIVTFCGIIDGPGPFANQRNAINNLAEGLAEIQVYKDLGYQQIKLYSSIKPEWVKPMIDKAHGLGMRVSGHIPAYMTASQAIELGYNEIQHINMLFLNFLSDTIDTRQPLRFTMVAKHGADLDLNSDEYQDFVKLLKSKDILVDPTISIFENMFISQKGERSPTYDKIIDRMPLIAQRGFYSGGLPKAPGKEDRNQEAFDKMLEVVFDLYNQGVAIVPGTDGLPGFLYHRELELYVRAGIPAAEVLKMATIKSAMITGVSDAYGSIAVGKNADLILIDGNPLDDISDIRKVELTMKGGNLFYAEELYGSMGIKHFK